MAEFAFVVTIFMIVLVVVVQYALVGQIVLAVTQLSYNCARAAAVNPTTGSTAVTSCKTNLAATSINDAHLTATLTTACGTPSFGTSAVVTVSYDLQGAGKIFLPATFPGLVPHTVSSVQKAFCEG
jgi:Flp pilus assembly protein TadG